MVFALTLIDLFIDSDTILNPPLSQCISGRPGYLELVSTEEFVGLRWIVFVLIMVFTEKELIKWNGEALKEYLSSRGISLSGGGSRKADLIKKVLPCSRKAERYMIEELQNYVLIVSKFLFLRS